MSANIRDLEQLLLKSVGLSDRTDVSDVTIHFAANELPQVTVVFEVVEDNEELGSLFGYIAEHYTLSPKDGADDNLESE